MCEQDHDHIAEFTIQLISTGSTLNGLIESLSDALPDDAFPGEEPAAVVIEMICGTIATALEQADPCEVRRASELIEMACARTFEHLELAGHLSRRMHGEDGLGRNYG